MGSDLFASAYFLYKRYEDHLAELVGRYPKLVQGGNLLDVGANIGYTAQILARAADPGHVVYAFEPEPFNYTLLERVARRPEFAGRIIAHQCAVGAEDGTVQLWFNRHHVADHRVITESFRRANPAVTGITVPMASIDTFLAQNPGRVSFIKIDVQGFEQAVCEGMKATLERNPGLTLLLEYAPSAMEALGFHPSELIRFLSGYGLKCYVVGPRGKLSPGPLPDLSEFDYVDLLFSRAGIAPGADI